VPKSFLAHAEYHDRHLLDATGFTPPQFLLPDPRLYRARRSKPQCLCLRQDFYFGIGTALTARPSTP